MATAQGFGASGVNLAGAAAFGGSGGSQAVINNQLHRLRLQEIEDFADELVREFPGNKKIAEIAEKFKKQAIVDFEKPTPIPDSSQQTVVKNAVASAQRASGLNSPVSKIVDSTLFQGVGDAPLVQKGRSTRVGGNAEQVTNQVLQQGPVNPIAQAVQTATQPRPGVPLTATTVPPVQAARAAPVQPSPVPTASVGRGGGSGGIDQQTVNQIRGGGLTPGQQKVLFKGAIQFTGDQFEKLREIALGPRPTPLKDLFGNEGQQFALKTFFQRQVATATTPEEKKAAEENLRQINDIINKAGAQGAGDPGATAKDQLRIQRLRAELKNEDLSPEEKANKRAEIAQLKAVIDKRGAKAGEQETKTAIAKGGILTSQLESIAENIDEFTGGVPSFVQSKITELKKIQQILDPKKRGRRLAEFTEQLGRGATDELVETLARMSGLTKPEVIQIGNQLVKIDHLRGTQKVIFTAEDMMMGPKGSFFKITGNDKGVLSAVKVRDEVLSDIVKIVPFGVDLEGQPVEALMLISPSTGKATHIKGPDGNNITGPKGSLVTINEADPAVAAQMQMAFDFLFLDGFMVEIQLIAFDEEGNFNDDLVGLLPTLTRDFLFKTGIDISAVLGRPITSAEIEFVSLMHQLSETRLRMLSGAAIPITERELLEGVVVPDPSDTPRKFVADFIIFKKTINIALDAIERIAFKSGVISPVPGREGGSRKDRFRLTSPSGNRVVPQIGRAPGTKTPGFSQPEQRGLTTPGAGAQNDGVPTDPQAFFDAGKKNKTGE